MAALTIEQAQAILAENAAPWAQDLGLVVEEIEPGRARLRMPHAERLQRIGGTICGQALMACADTAMIVVIASALGGYRPMTTVGQTISFMRPAKEGGGVIAEGRLLKLGRSLAFGDVTLYSVGGAEAVAQATSTYALLAPGR